MANGCNSLSSLWKISYLHYSIDTFSHHVLWTPLTGETFKHVRTYLLYAFSILGRPQTIKSDNGPAYTSKNVQKFCTQWKMCHIMGIPHNSTGQAIMQCTHATLKTLLKKQKKGNITEAYTPQNQITKPLFPSWPSDASETTPIEKHFHVHQDNPKPLVLYCESLGENIWKGPVQMLTWGRGDVFVLSPTGPLWIPAKVVKPYHELAYRTYKSHSRVSTTDMESAPGIKAAHHPLPVTKKSPGVTWGE